MNRHVACLAAVLCAGLSAISFAQSASQAQPSTAPVAFVYVSSSPQNNGWYQINGFSAGQTPYAHSRLALRGQCAQHGG
jgi:hypothetical protein